jgi:glycosyltransferase involved in cell wall biosynthesis
MGGPGVQRWLKMIKYLPESGWDTIVYMPANPSFQLLDHSLMDDVRENQVVLRQNIREPHQLFYRAKGQKDLGKVIQKDILDKKNKSFFEKAGIWLRGNIFIPDSRIFWVRPSVRYLLPKLREHQIEVIITTGPPHSLHLIGKKLREKSGIPWVADFRDPWTNWILLEEFNVSPPAMRIHQRMERQVLQSADEVLTVSSTWQQDLSRLGDRKVRLLTNGYDEDDFREVSRSMPDDKFRISYFGTIDKVRDPRPFMSVVRELCLEMPDFRQRVEVNFTGYLSGIIMQELQQDEVLREVTRTHGYLPHQQMLQEFGNAALLLLLLNSADKSRGILLGKIFEYLASGKPIIALGNPKGDVAKVLAETRVGELFVPDDHTGIKMRLLDYYQQYKTASYQRKSEITQYSRRNLSRSLAGILDETTKK